MSHDAAPAPRASEERRIPRSRLITSYILLAIVGVCMGLPFVWMVLASFKHRNDAESTDFLPRQWHPENYAVVLGLAKNPSTIGKDTLTLKDGTQISGVDRVYFNTPKREPLAGRILEEDTGKVVIDTPSGVQTAVRSEIEAVDVGGGKYLPIEFGKWYFNSVFIAAWLTFLKVLTSAMAGYAFARIDWPGRDRVFLLYLGTMMIPGVVLMIPNFQTIISAGLYNSYLGLIIPGAFSAYGTFLMRQFMLGIPKSLDEAAQVDGATHWQLFWDVIMPLSRPGLITLAIFTFMGTYQSFFWPLVMLKDEWRYTLPIGMLHFDSTQGRATELVMAATVMNIIPLIIIFVVMQKYLVKGIQLGGVKG